MCNISNKILVPVVVVLILLPQMLAQPKGKLHPRINNGYLCDTTVAPYFVIIHTFGKDGGACGGSLITYSWVLTGAHCLGVREGQVFSAYDRPQELKQVRNIKEIHPHPSYNIKEGRRDFRRDIGLILVDKPFHETAATRVATLPAPGFTKQCNRVFAPGIGLKYTNESFWAVPLERHPLMCANLSIIDINTCKKNYSMKHFDTTLTICTTGQEIRSGPCEGDSGGPLICDNVVIGTVIGGLGCSERIKPTAYARVESYLDFIDSFVKFTEISIKNVHSNGTSVGATKAPDKSLANIVQGPIWKLVLFTPLYLFFYN